MDEPALPLTVDIELWEAVADAVRPTFADSYLSGAIQIGRNVTPHTAIAYDRLTANEKAAQAMDGLNIKLVRPLPFGHPQRMDGV